MKVTFSNNGDRVLEIYPHDLFVPYNSNNLEYTSCSSCMIKDYFKFYLNILLVYLVHKLKIILRIKLETTLS